MCGIIPLLHCESSVSSSTTARSTLSGARPTATNAASQLHMCGYSSGAAVVIAPEVVAAQQVGGAGRQLGRRETRVGGHGFHLRPRRAHARQRRSDTVASTTAMITGAGGGLGAAIADALAPTHTLFLAGRPSARLDTVAERLGASTWPVDFADLDAIADTVEPIVELDVLVHNAGVAYPGRVADSSVDSGAPRWRSMWLAPLLYAGAAAALRAGGRVVFINSGAGRTPSPGLASYSASKFACARSPTHCAPTNRLRVTTVYPGRIDTEMQRDLVAYEGGEYRANGSCERRRWRSSSPTRTRPPTPTCARGRRPAR
jgi:NADP-dependent 3-hydroxy acid dehydrogenase YdfG